MVKSAPSNTTADELRAALDAAQVQITAALDLLQFNLPDGYAVSSVTVDVLNADTVADYLDRRFAVAINVEVKG